NRVQDGFMSNHLCGLDEGAEIAFQGPLGDFILRPPLRDTVFIATGTGIAPFRSMLHWLLAESDRHQGRQFWLLFGARREQDIYYREEFERLAGEATCNNIWQKSLEPAPTCTPTSAASTRWSRQTASC